MRNRLLDMDWGYKSKPKYNVKENYDKIYNDPFVVDAPPVKKQEKKKKLVKTFMFMYGFIWCSVIYTIFSIVMFFLNLIF
tara:strand:- start:681 stop:920 length:240 start_codon:yes stop_codon:yes gene_type:complete